MRKWQRRCHLRDARADRGASSKGRKEPFRVVRRCNSRFSQYTEIQKKKDQLSLAQYGDKLTANRPGPDDPGGLGAEESGAERTGPTQDCLVATQRGGRLAEVGRYYDSANDPVTACFRSNRRFQRHFVACDS